MGVCIQEVQSAPCNERTKTFIYYWLESATKMAWILLTIRPTNVLAIDEYLGDSGAANVLRQCLLNSTSILCTRYHTKK